MADAAFATDCYESFDLTTLLSGRTRAWGVFEDRQGTVRRRFEIDIRGGWQGREFVMQEDFQFDDGERTTKEWRVRPLPGGVFEAVGDDVVGVARGETTGNVIRMAYRYRLKVNGRSFAVDYDDRIYRIDETRAMNRATVSKWGVRLGDVTLIFQKLPNDDSANHQHSPRIIGPVIR